MGPRLRPSYAECGPFRWSPSLVVTVEPDGQGSPPARFNQQETAQCWRIRYLHLPGKGDRRFHRAIHTRPRAFAFSGICGRATGRRRELGCSKP